MLNYVARLVQSGAEILGWFRWLRHVGSLATIAASAFLVQSSKGGVPKTAHAGRCSTVMCAAREGIVKHTSPTASGVFSSFEVCQRPPVCSLLDLAYDEELSRRPHAEAESAPTSASHPDRSEPTSASHADRSYLNDRDGRDRVRVYDMDGKHISPFGFPTLPGRLEVNIVLGMKFRGIVINEKAKLHWLLADDGTEVRVRAPNCICFVNPALVADGDDPVGLHGTVVSGMATVPGATVPERHSCLKRLDSEHDIRLSCLRR